MKIVFLVDYLPDQLTTGGGLQNYVVRIAQQLHKLGEKVCVVHRYRSTSKVYPFNVKTVSVPYKEKKLLQLLQSITLHKFDNSLTQLQNA